MSFALGLTPKGRILIVDESAPLDAWSRKGVDAFRAHPGRGLFILAAHPPATPPSPSVSFWRELGSRYVERLCQAPEVEELETEEVERLIRGVPPMPGAEYLDEEVLRRLWSELDGWVRQDVAASGEGLAEWLKSRAGDWHQVGRVCFHLAENKGQPELPFAFLATYAPTLSKSGKVQYQPLGQALKEYAGERNRKALVQLLTPVHRASEKSGFVKELVDSGEIFHPLAWVPSEAYRLLKDVPVLEESGLLVRIPDWWRKRPRPRVAVTLGESKQSRFGADEMLDFRADLALGDATLSEAEWKKILAAEDGLVRLKGQWVEVDRVKLAETLAHWKRVERAAEDGISFIEGMRLLAGAAPDLGAAEGPAGNREWSEVVAGQGLSETLAGLRDPSRLSGGPRGDFRGELRPYQETGRRWLRFLTGLGLGACLADDMGLGKTVQVLSLMTGLKEEEISRKPSVLVLPASLLANWKSEIARFAPELRTRFVHPSEEDVGGQPDLVVTTYGMLQRQERLLEVEWRLAILDEAQAIKNPGAAQSKAVKRLRAEARIALTGTPVENRLGDLWSLFDFLNPGLLGSTSTFKSFVKKLEENYAPLRELVKPYILRRLKTDRRIIADLPDKTELKVHCGLSKRQAALYAKAVEELELRLGGNLGGMARRGTVLAYLLRLKQICNHPGQFLGDGNFDPSASGKFDRLRVLGEEIASRQEKALVFTQFREMTEPIASFLAEVFGRPGIVLHGATAVAKRKSLVDAFQREDGPPFFVLSLKAGGTGLNLTAASHVIHFDRWWNPAVENQATDRAFRIGQRKNVLVHKFVCRGTVEEKIDALIEEKTKLAGDLLEGGAEVLLTELNDKDLLNLVALDITKAETQGGES
jgi:non-specific serine/threonine protein kinase